MEDENIGTDLPITAIGFTITFCFHTKIKLVPMAVIYRIEKSGLYPMKYLKAAVYMDINIFKILRRVYSMAEAFSSTFDEWIRSLLNDLQSNDDDMSDFVQYLMGIITSDSETDEEKQTAIVELLADLDLKHDHNIDNLSEQILHRWYQSRNDQNHLANSTKSRVANGDDDVISNALINAMNQIESSAKQNRTSNDPNSNKLNDDAASQKHKSHVLAKYSQVSDEELEYDDEHEPSSNALFQNTNTQDVEDRERKVRDVQHEAYKKQQDKNKVDANNQRQKDDERKKKAQQRAQKQERRR